MAEAFTMGFGLPPTKTNRQPAKSTSSSVPSVRVAFGYLLNNSSLVEPAMEIIAVAVEDKDLHVAIQQWLESRQNAIQGSVKIANAPFTTPVS
jgi:hypothetical protein